MSSPFSCRTRVAACALLLGALLLTACGDNETRTSYVGTYRLDRREYVRDFVAQRVEQHADRLRALPSTKRRDETRAWVEEATRRAKTLAMELTLGAHGTFQVAGRMGKAAHRHAGAWTSISGGVRLHTTHAGDAALDRAYDVDADSDGKRLRIDRSDMDQPFVLRRVDDAR